MNDSGRRQTEETLRLAGQPGEDTVANELFNRLQKIASHLPGMIYQFRLWPDGRTCFPYSSDGIQMIYGLRPEDVETDAAPAFEVIHPDDRQRVTDVILESAANLTLWHDQYRVTHPSGRILWVEGYSSPELLPDGSVIWHGYIADITERKIVEEELRESETRLRAIMEWTQDAILMMDAEGVVTFCNPAAEAVFGYVSQELIGQDLHRLLSPERYLEKAQTALPVFKRTGNGNAVGKTIELAALRKDGQEIDIEMSLSAVTQAGQWHAVGVIRDITQRKQAELVLLTAKAEAEKANRAKSSFLANMSHELRTPMNGILGTLQLLEFSPLDDEQRESISQAKQTGWGLLELINDILDLSAIEAGQLTIRSEAFDPAVVARNCVQILRPVASSKSLDLHLRLDPALPGSVRGDSVRVRQILLNLLGNAVKFTRVGEVTCTLRAFIDTTGRQQLEFIITDTGIGIPAEQLDRIFDPFAQVEGTYRRQFQGAGLGLSIVRQLVNMMAGTLTLTSQPGEGTTLTLTIPAEITAGRESSAGKQLQQKSQAEMKKVLVAEDNPINQSVIRGMLKKLGYDATLVDTGDKALRTLTKSPYDLILMDIQMPVMDGVEATHAIRAGKAGEHNRKVPIVAMTAFAMVGDKESFLAEGLDDYLGKPVLMEDLRACIARHLAEKTE